MTVDELRDRDAAVFFNLFYPPREAWDDAWRAARIAARQQHPVRRAWAERELGGHGSLGVFAYRALESRDADEPMTYLDIPDAVHPDGTPR